MGTSGPVPVERAERDRAGGGANRLTPLRFVLVFGVVSRLGDVVYERARSVTGPFLASFGAGAALVGLITGAGEAVALVLRLPFGLLSDRTGRPWPITIAGYAITMVAVPLLAVAWALWPAAVLAVMERFGKAVRTPARDTTRCSPKRASTSVADARSRCTRRSTRAAPSSDRCSSRRWSRRWAACAGASRCSWSPAAARSRCSRTCAAACRVRRRSSAGRNTTRPPRPAAASRFPALLAVRRLHRGQHARVRHLGGPGVSPARPARGRGLHDRDHVRGSDGRGRCRRARLGVGV